MPNDEVEISPGIKVKPVLTTTFDMEAYTALMPTEEEIAAYRTAECGWKAARILPHVSWGEFVEWAKGRDSWIDVNDYCPCDSKDGHCSFACAKFGDKCPYGK